MGRNKPIVEHSKQNDLLAIDGLAPNLLQEPAIIKVAVGIGVVEASGRATANEAIRYARL